MPKTTAPTDLAKITKDLGAAYKKWKGGETLKNKHKSRFWTAIDELALADPEEKLVEVEPDDLFDEDTLTEYLAREYPAWDLDAHQTRVDGKIEAILTLKPEFKAFEYVNADDGMVYARQFVNGSPVIDDERLREELPDLWIEITEIPNIDEIVSLVRALDYDWVSSMEREVEGFTLENSIDEVWQGKRTLKSLDSLDAETLAIVQAFVHPGAPSTKFPAPRKAKPEELDVVAEDIDLDDDDDGSGYPDGLE